MPCANAAGASTSAATSVSASFLKIHHSNQHESPQDTHTCRYGRPVMRRLCSLMLHPDFIGFSRDSQSGLDSQIVMCSSLFSAQARPCRRNCSDRISSTVCDRTQVTHLPSRPGIRLAVQVQLHARIFECGSPSRLAAGPEVT